MRDFLLLKKIMPAIIEQITKLVVPSIEQEDSFLVEVNFRGEKASKVIEIFVDSDKGISIDQCSAISKKLSALLDEANLIEGRYRLDVSSPGLDRPLRIFRQYTKNVGRTCKVTYMQDGKKTECSGELKNVSEASLVLQQDKKNEIEIPFSAVVETYIIPKIK